MPFVTMQFLKFAAVGASNSLVHYAVFMILWGLLKVHYLEASTAGYCCGLLNSFIWNCRWTFAYREGFYISELLRFVSVNMLALATSLAEMFFLVSIIELKAGIAQLIAIGFSMWINFVGNKHWTFKKEML